MIYVGIDYSLTSPAVCVYNTASGDFCFDNTRCFFVATKKMHEGYDDGIIKANSTPMLWKTPQERYIGLTNWALNSMGIDLHTTPEDDMIVYIEDYAFAAKGRVFHIAENTGILKDRLHRYCIPFETVAPSAIKKFATTKGNANKDQMYDSFCELYPEIDLKKRLMSSSSKVSSPISDIVDAYFICSYAFKHTSNMS